MTIPAEVKIYHIVHVDRLASIIKDGFLWCDAEVVRQPQPGTKIGMDHIKERRLNKLKLSSHPDLHVGECVPFYFCPRSVMLYLIHRANNQELKYRGGQEPIVHLEADLYDALSWANHNNIRWAFTLSNAGSFFFEDRCDLTRLGDINWDAVNARQWSGAGIDPSIKEEKQAEFLMQNRFPWQLIERIGVLSLATYQRVNQVLATSGHRPKLEIIREWYY
jgi:hypothetical protein